MHSAFPRRGAKTCPPTDQTITLPGENKFIVPALSPPSNLRPLPGDTVPGFMRPQRPPDGFCRNPVPPAEPQRSSLFPTTKNAASSRGCATSCCEWFQSVRAPEPRNCPAPAAADPNFPTVKSAHCSNHAAFPAYIGPASPPVPEPSIAVQQRARALRPRPCARPDPRPGLTHPANFHHTAAPRPAASLRALVSPSPHPHTRKTAAVKSSAAVQ